MNWIILSEMRTGSSYLGDLIQSHNFPYFNEPFTPEICRRARIVPRGITNRTDAFFLQEIWATPRAGFKLIYNQATPEVWSRLVLADFVKVIHLTRDDFLEQYASVLYLEGAGVSSQVDGVCRGTNGNPVDPDPGFQVCVDLLHLADWLDRTIWHREYIRKMFYPSHDWIELSFPAVFSVDVARRVLDFLEPGAQYIANAAPVHEATPRPRAREMFTNYEQCVDVLQDKGSNYGQNAIFVD